MIEVLFVDDHVSEIEPVVRTFQLRTKLEAACTDNVDEALRIVREQHVKVAVLDQRMEELLNLNGTELYDKLCEVDPRIRGIIFSGESDKADVIEANRRELRYLDKGCTPEELAQEVLRQRAQYLAEVEREHARTAVTLGRYRRRWLPVPGQVVELLTIDELSPEPEVREADYVTVSEIGSGQTRREVGKAVVEHEVEIERESEAELESALKLGSGPVSELNARVRDLIRERAKVRRYAHTERTLEETAQLSKADEAAEVIHRRIDMAPTFMRRRALLRSTCECCGEVRIVAINVRQWTGRYRQKQIDTYRDTAKQPPRTYILGDR